MERYMCVKRVMRSMVHLNSKHRRIMKDKLKTTGVFESQHRLLMTIADNKEYSQKQLADIMRVSTATVAVALKKLEQGGFVERIVNNEDNRYNKIVLTDKGSEVVEASKSIFREVDLTLVDGFSQEEVEFLTECLSRMNNNLDRLLEKEIEE